MDPATFERKLREYGKAQRMIVYFMLKAWGDEYRVRGAGQECRADEYRREMQARRDALEAEILTAFREQVEEHCRAHGVTVWWKTREGET